MEMSIVGIKKSVIEAAKKVEAKAKVNPKATLAIGAGAVAVTVIAFATGSALVGALAAIVALAVAILVKRNPEILKPLTESKRFQQIKASVKGFLKSKEDEDASEAVIATKPIQPKRKPFARNGQ